MRVLHLNRGASRLTLVSHTRNPSRPLFPWGNSAPMLCSWAATPFPSCESCWEAGLLSSPEEPGGSSGGLARERHPLHSCSSTFQPHQSCSAPAAVTVQSCADSLHLDRLQEASYRFASFLPSFRAVPSRQKTLRLCTPWGFPGSALSYSGPVRRQNTPVT